MVLGSDNKYVVSVPSTEEEKIQYKVGQFRYSGTDYVMTMNVDKGYGKSYKIRPYVVLRDGSVVYGAHSGI